MIIRISGVEFKPSEMKIGIQDISAPDSGRDQSGTMHKLLLCQKRKIELAWWCPSPQLTAQILQAVKPEYFTVEYTDPETNTWVARTMYVGDRSAPVEMWGNDRKFYSKVSFNVIER